MRKLNVRNLLALAIPALIPSAVMAQALVLEAPVESAPAVNPAPAVSPAPDTQPKAESAPANSPATDPGPSNGKILVLPFEAVNPNESNPWLGKSVQQSLVADLMVSAPDRVVAADQPVSTVEAALAVGRREGARYVIAGGFVTSDRAVRITGQVLDTTNGHAISGLKATGDTGQIFRMEDGLAFQVKERLFPARRPRPFRQHRLPWPRCPPPRLRPPSRWPRRWKRRETIIQPVFALTMVRAIRNPPPRRTTAVMPPPLRRLTMAPVMRRWPTPIIPPLTTTPIRPMVTPPITAMATVGAIPLESVSVSAFTTTDTMAIITTTTTATTTADTKAVPKAAAAVTTPAEHAPTATLPPPLTSARRPSIVVIHWQPRTDPPRFTNAVHLADPPADSMAISPPIPSEAEPLSTPPEVPEARI